MSLFEKITVTFIVVVLTVSFSIYGVWEDKMTFLSILIPLLYTALAVWAVGALRRQKSEVRAEAKRRPAGGYDSNEVATRKSEPTDQESPTSRLRQGYVGQAGVRSSISASKVPLSDIRCPTSDFAPSSASHIPRSTAYSIPPGGILLLLFWLYSAIMIPFSVIPYEAKISTLRFGCYVGTYWATANILSRFPQRKAVWSVLFLALLAVASYSLVQHQTAPEWVLWAKRYITPDSGRLGGTYICPNHIAHLFQMWIPLCVVFLFIPQFGWFWRICFGYALPVFGLLIYRTQSRAGMLGTVASVIMLFLLVMLRKSRKAFVIALIAAPLLAAVGVGALWAGAPAFRERMQPVAKVISQFFAGNIEEAISIDFRPKTWMDSLVMIKDRPLLGVGPGNYGQTFPEYRQRVFSNRMETVHPHNEPIELLTEYGLIGAGLFLGVLIAFCVPLVRMIKTSPRPYHVLPAAAFLAALAGTFVHGLFDFELRIFPNALMLSVLAGCAAAPLLRSQRSETRDQKTDSELATPDPRPPTSLDDPRTSVLRYLLSITLLLAALWSLQVMSSEGLRVCGDHLRLSGERSRAEKLYDVALAIDPKNWRAYLGLGQVYSYYRYQELNPVEKRKLAVQERDIFAQAYRCNTKKEEVVYGLGRAELAAGKCEAGLDRLRQAAHYKRFNDFYWRKLGIELRKAGHYEEALKTFLYAQKLNRGNATVNYNIKWLKDKMSESTSPPSGN